MNQTQIKEKECCATCYFYTYKKQCVENSPQAQIFIPLNGAEPILKTFWPTPNPDDFCGRYEPRNPSPKPTKVAKPKAKEATSPTPPE